MTVQRSYNQKMGTADSEEETASKKMLISSEDMSNVFSKINISEELKHTVKLLLLSEQNNIITSVLKKLNGDKQTWERAQKEPVFLLTLLAQEQQESMNSLQRHLGAVAEAAQQGKEKEELHKTNKNGKNNKDATT
jgi:dsDNA-binding SOS-regulon protein